MLLCEGTYSVSGFTDHIKHPTSGKSTASAHRALHAVLSRQIQRLAGSRFCLSNAIQPASPHGVLADLWGHHFLISCTVCTCHSVSWPHFHLVAILGRFLGNRLLCAVLLPSVLEMTYFLTVVLLPHSPVQSPGPLTKKVREEMHVSRLSPKFNII